MYCRSRPDRPARVIWREEARGSRPTSRGREVYEYSLAGQLVGQLSRYARTATLWARGKSFSKEIAVDLI